VLKCDSKLRMVLFILVINDTAVYVIVRIFSAFWRLIVYVIDSSDYDDSKEQK